MFQYVIAGLVLGGIYAIAATGLVVTFLSAGILNFSFGALAYAVARLYYYLNTQHHWSHPAIGDPGHRGRRAGPRIFFYFTLFRRLRLTSTLVKIVVTLGVSVAIPSLARSSSATQTILKAPGLAPQPVQVFHVGVPVTLDQIIVYFCVVAVVVVGVVVLRYTDVGLRVRAMVDSPAMTSLSGTTRRGCRCGCGR